MWENMARDRFGTAGFHPASATLALTFSRAITDVSADYIKRVCPCPLSEWSIGLAFSGRGLPRPPLNGFLGREEGHLPSTRHHPTLHSFLRNKKGKKKKNLEARSEGWLLLLLLLFRRRNLFDIPILHENIFSCNYIKYERRGGEKS